MNPTHECSLTPEKILADLKMVVQITGFETPDEIERLHMLIYHDINENYFWDDIDFYGTESVTVKELEVQDKHRILWYGKNRCAHCPPYRGENGYSKPRRGAKRPKSKFHNKKQGLNAKTLDLHEERMISSIKKQLKVRK